LEIVAFLLLLISSPEERVLRSLLDEHAERASASRSAVALLRILPELDGRENEAARLLLADDLAEMALVPAAQAEYRRLLDSPASAAAASVALARLYGDAEEPELLRGLAGVVPWRSLDDRDFAETAFRLGRACHLAGRRAEAREWLAEIPRESDYHPFARYLAAQVAYADGRYAEAVAAASDVLEREGSSDVLRDRAAILLGDMLTEIGQYDKALGFFSRTSAESPYRDRAERDRRIAQELRDALGASRRSIPARMGEVEKDLRSREEEILAAARPGAGLEETLEDLKRSWPSRELAAMRRRWTQRRAAEALEGGIAGTIGRLLSAAWETLPPVMALGLARSDPDEARPVPEMSPAARFFFVPTPRTARLLVAAALTAERREEDCAGGAAATLRDRAVRAHLGLAPMPSGEEVAEIAAGCGREETVDLRSAIDERLRAELGSEARAQARLVEAQRHFLDQAVGAAYVDRDSAIRAAREDR
jgi:tetratricopeptide (TPR) repeat protein